ncbi:ead/Ea22-like family protein [Klebsiella pneumoniae]|uniref:ead/Ea22-like family protein n=1 Tax=Klebsiella pneumoniae TaxID=573 RepID=UPI000EF203DE|nr:ead/Ea22-like family protein [Klebsiella pneumoniae]RLK91562.1 ead/Ea22-like family protein [Klebsiella pneumoniae]HDS5969103.1 ead/Ea22-like family protein [Klebsiella pneumoniae subsp. pneumoniae]
MTDITELAQSLKAAAEKATQGNWRAFQYHDGRCGIGGGHNDEIMVCEHISKERPHDAMFTALANPANVLALVEALERAQAGEKQWREVVDAFCSDDADWHKLTNSNNELIALLSQALCKQADRIDELESRTVKLPDLRQIVSGDRYVWSDGVYNYSQDVKVALAAAGIKVEAE